MVTATELCHLAATEGHSVGDKHVVHVMATGSSIQGTSTLLTPTDCYSDNKDHVVMAIKGNP